TSFARSTTSSRSTPAPAKSRVDNYRSVNALAEALNSLFKAEVIRNLGPWKGIDDVEIATAEWVHWFNTFRPHLSLGGLTPQAFRDASSTTVPEPLPETLNAR
ncbi:integrase core domain-containing protein, partial [Brachybacterium tyrofermentans]